MAPPNFLSLKEKVSVIDIAENEKLSVRDIAKSRFNIGKTQAANILKNKDFIKNKWQTGDNVNCKKNFLSEKGSKVDKFVFEWFSLARAKNIPLSGPIVKAKAKEVAEKVGYNNFTASDGWLQKWRKRHNVAFKCISGEAADIIPEDVTQFKEKLPLILSKYRPEDVYNADESGLFFRALPNRTLSLKSEKCAGGKLSKERLTILFCVNMLGEKEKLLVIGKAARPRAFKNTPVDALPVDWKSNKKAWMTGEIMTEWLKGLNERMMSCNRKIILFLDNAASHPKELVLTNVTIHFLPANTTSVCQPLDQGIIQNFIVNYRTLILKHILSKMNLANSASELSKGINVLDALCFIKTAWEKVEAIAIENCFRKSGFIHTNDDVEEFEPQDDLPLSTLINFYKLCDVNEDNFEDFVNIDECASTENDLIENILEDPEEILISDEDQEILSEPSGINTFEEAFTQIQQLKAFSSNDFVAYSKLMNLESHYEEMWRKQRQSNYKQTTIQQFFRS